MGKSGGPAPDYKGAAGQTQDASQQAIGQQTQSNRPDQNNGLASSHWTQGPNGQWSQSSSFNDPGMQNAYGQLGQQAADSLGKPLDYSQFGKLDNGSDAFRQTSNAAYGQSASRLDPQWDQRQEQERAQLASQGLDPSSQAYQREMDGFSRQRNDAYQGAQNNAFMTGSQAQANTFGENMGARQQGINEMMQRRNAPLQGLQQMQGLMGQQGFQGAGAWNPGQYLQAAGMQGDYQLGQADTQNKLMGSALSGAGGMVASALPALLLSDERTKTNIERHDTEAIPGVPQATFEYRHEPGKKRHGVIAQDLEKVRPDLVKTGPDGLKRVPNRPPFAF